ncbi:carbonyl reductase [Apodospora peruviana]|uniref:Carbonyl reductase n=1 Tax=Apodospora peruviana TaxID=516989 RepID=A0AAE0HU65_9PEZI|nr:carbonyl reductase [Apodospora peruviana]
MSATHRTIALVTGANQGIGRAVALALARDHNYLVLVGSRSVERGEKAVAELSAQLGVGVGDKFRFLQLDLVSDESITAAIATIEKDYGHLDVLVNNAAVFLDAIVNDEILSTRELFTQTFMTNVISTAALTEAMLPLLRKAEAKPPRLVFVSSFFGSLSQRLAGDETAQWYDRDSKAYDSSKAAMNMLMLNYARILKDVNGKVNAVCPGLVATSLNKHIEGGKTPEEGTERIVQAATLGEDGETGTFSNIEGTIPF